MHRAPGGRHSPETFDRAFPAYGLETGRPAVLLHDMRLDDVELARLRPCSGWNASPLRRLSLLSQRTGALRFRRRGRDDDFRNIGEIHRRGAQDRMAPEGYSPVGKRADDVLHGFAL